MARCKDFRRSLTARLDCNFLRNGWFMILDVSVCNVHVASFFQIGSRDPATWFDTTIILAFPDSGACNNEYHAGAAINQF